MNKRKVFVSYSHAQKDWVRDRLIPCLDAVGAEVLVDYRKFGAGKPLPAQMDALVDDADVNLLVFSPEYLASPNCQREMERAFLRDPDFSGITLPVIRQKCTLPPALTAKNPLWVDLEDDGVPERWEEVFKATTGKNLGATAPAWLTARDEVHRHLLDNATVSLEIRGDVEWRALIANLREKVSGLKQVDLGSGATVPRQGLVAEILAAASGASQAVPPPPGDLLALDRGLMSLPLTRLALLHFDLVVDKERKYGGNLFDALRYLIERERLSVLFVSRRPFLDLIPKDHALSRISSLRTIRLEATP